MIRALSAGIAILCVAATGAGCSSAAKCGAANCQGCCTVDGVCQLGNTTNACGASGQACTACSLSQSCELGSCSAQTGGCTASNCSGCCNQGQCVTACPTGDVCGANKTCQSGGDGGVCNATTCAQGCCQGTTCLPLAQQTNACGNGGSTCQACTGTTQSCQGGACISGCGPGNCQGCCNGSSCVLFANETTLECGTTSAAGAACTGCVGSATCTGGTCTANTLCNAGNCQGCCMGSSCVLLANETTTACGTTADAGSACVSCGGGQSCSGGICSGGTSCNAINCAGCCNGGSCVLLSNETNLECGSGPQAGAACTQCTGIQACTQGVCAIPVTTVAGNGVAGFMNGTGGATGTAEFDAPDAVALDSAGNLFVADSTNNRIRKVDPAGNVTTLAGSGVAGFKDGSSTVAQFNFPRGIAVDSAGNVYVGDSLNRRVRLVSPLGDVVTIAGNGDAGFFDGSGGPTGTSMFSYPRGLGLDTNGNIYVADMMNNRVRKIDSTGNVSTVAGNGIAAELNGTGGPTGTAEMNQPAALAVVGAGTLYVADEIGSALRKVDLLGNVTTLTSTGLGEPAGVALDSSGNVIVGDFSLNEILKVDSQGVVTVLAGNTLGGFADGTAGPGGTARFLHPHAVVIDSAGTMYVADTGNNRIRAIR